MRAAASSSAARSSGADGGDGGVDLGGGEGEGRGGQAQAVPALGQLDDRGVAAGARRRRGSRRHRRADVGVGLALLRQEDARSGARSRARACRGRRAWPARDPLSRAGGWGRSARGRGRGG